MIVANRTMVGAAWRSDSFAPGALLAQISESSFAALVDLPGEAVRRSLSLQPVVAHGRHQSESLSEAASDQCEQLLDQIRKVLADEDDNRTEGSEPATTPVTRHRRLRSRVSYPARAGRPDTKNPAARRPPPVRRRRRPAAANGQTPPRPDFVSAGHRGTTTSFLRVARRPNGILHVPRDYDFEAFRGAVASRHHWQPFGIAARPPPAALIRITREGALLDDQ